MNNNGTSKYMNRVREEVGVSTRKGISWLTLPRLSRPIYESVSVLKEGFVGAGESLKGELLLLLFYKIYKNEHF